MVARAVALPTAVAENRDGSNCSGFGKTSESLRIALVKSNGVECHIEQLDIPDVPKYCGSLWNPVADVFILFSNHVRETWSLREKFRP